MTDTAAGARRIWRLAFALACAAWWIQKLGWRHPVGEWDFRIYYHAALAWRSGLDPYNPQVLPADLYAEGFRFSYPPYALPLFAPLTVLPLLRAMQLFIALKIAAFACLLSIWTRLARTTVTAPLWVLFLLFAYSSAVFVDFVAGSITTFEQLLIWIGVAALLKERRWLFVASVAAASLFRMTPIVLLLVCLAAPDRRRVRYVAVGAAAFGAILLVTWAVTPRLMAGFAASVLANTGERGWLNPAALPLAIDLAGLVRHSPAGGHPTPLAVALYLAIVAAVLGPTVLTIRRVAATAAPNRTEVIVYISFLAAALVLPRFKNYSYMLLIVPTYYIAARATRVRQFVPLLVIACLPIYSWITNPAYLALVADYAKWLIALGALAVYVYEVRGGTLLQPAVELT